MDAALTGSLTVKEVLSEAISLRGELIFIFLK